MAVLTAVGVAARRSSVVRVAVAVASAAMLVAILIWVARAAPVMTVDAAETAFRRIAVVMLALATSVAAWAAASSTAEGPGTVNATVVVDTALTDAPN